MKHLLNAVYSETDLRHSWLSSFITKHVIMKKYQNSTTYYWSAAITRVIQKLRSDWLLRKNKFIRHNFMNKWPWNLRKMQGKWRNGESSVLSNLLFNSIHHRRSTAPWIIMHIFMSFIKQSHPSAYHWTAHGMFCIHIKKLMMNFSWFHVLGIQETDYRPHFTCGGILYFIKHYKHTAWCVNTFNVCKLCLCLATELTNSAHMCTIMTAVLQCQYS
jgi:hypothetical protein